jgi:hypothetical protein
MIPTLAIAKNTVREAVRRPLFAMMLAVASIIVLLSPAFAAFSFNDSYKLVVDLSFSTMLTAAFVISVIISSTVMSEEIESRTALTVLAKPVSRTRFLIGKFIGVAAVGWIAVWTLGLLSLLVARGAMADTFLLPDPHYRQVVGWALWGFVWSVAMHFYGKEFGTRRLAVPSAVALGVFAPCAATFAAYLGNRLPFDIPEPFAWTFLSGWDFWMRWTLPCVAASLIGGAAVWKGRLDERRGATSTRFVAAALSAMFIFSIGYLALLDWRAPVENPFAAPDAERSAYWPFELLNAAALGSMHVMIITAWAMLFSTRLALIPTMLFSLTALVCGQLVGWAAAAFRSASGEPSVIVTLLSLPLPNLDIFVVNDWLAVSYLQEPVAMPEGYLLNAGLYAVVHSLFALALAAASFETREIDA